MDTPAIRVHLLFPVCLLSPRSSSLLRLGFLYSCLPLCLRPPNFLGFPPFTTYQPRVRHRALLGKRCGCGYRGDRCPALDGARPSPGKRETFSSRLALHPRVRSHARHGEPRPPARRLRRWAASILLPLDAPGEILCGRTSFIFIFRRINAPARRPYTTT